MTTPTQPDLASMFNRFRQLSMFWKRQHCTPEIATQEMLEYCRLGPDIEQTIKRLTAFASLNTEPRFEAEARVVVEPPREDQGWRLLEPGEMIHKGDQYRDCSKGWTDTSIAGSIYEPGVWLPHRRRVTPPDTEYRMLEAGELIQPGDEWIVGGEWKPTVTINEPLMLLNVGRCRRKVVSNDTAGQGKEMEGKRDHEAASGQSGASEDGWRMLKAWEVIQEGDEIQRRGFPEWNQAEATVGMHMHQLDPLSWIVRRRIPAKEQP